MDVHCPDVEAANHAGPPHHDARRFRFIADHSLGAIYFVRPDASFSYVNQSAADMLGYTRDDLVKKSVIDIDPRYDAETWAARWIDLIEK